MYDLLLNFTGLDSISNEFYLFFMCIFLLLLICTVLKLLWTVVVRFF